MRLIATRLQRRLAADEGFSMVLVIMILIATGMFVAAGFAAANGDLPIARDSQDRKAAYAAAESGVNFYQFHLNADNDYWLKCDDVPKPNTTENNPVNQMWNGTGSDPRLWRKVAGSDAEYTIELIPATGKTECVNGDPTSMLDAATATFRIRVTGRPSANSTLRRTINATFRRAGFLDYLYFTHRETQDPMAYPTSGTTYDRDWAIANCGERLRSARHDKCVEIQFPTFDSLNGPLHTNDDSVFVCGTPTFGRNGGDKLEVAGLTAPGWKQNPEGGSSCVGSPVVKGAPFKVGAKTLSPPPSNQTLKAIAQSGGLLLTGKTTIEFQATGGMKVTNKAAGWTDKQVDMPANGVIYVQKSTVAGSCTTSVPPVQANYSEQDGCAKVYVSGKYSADVTLASADDIIVKSPNGTDNPNLVRQGDHVLGLVAENYVRVYHKIKSGDCSQNEAAMNDVNIEAAILSVQHSFIVDNYGCGQKLNKLNVTGAIAQKYRGPVGTGTATTVVTGYAKNYWYDDRLRYRTPPYFLNPVEVTWKVLRTNEQVPPTK